MHLPIVNAKSVIAFGVERSTFALTFGETIVAAVTYRNSHSVDFDWPVSRSKLTTSTAASTYTTAWFTLLTTDIYIMSLLSGGEHVNEDCQTSFSL